MSLLSASLGAIRAAREGKAATDAGLAALEAGHGPLVALRAFAAQTGVTFDDAAAVELEAGLRKALEGLALVSRGCVTIAEALQDPRVRKTLDQAIDRAIDVGLRAGTWRALLRSWLDG